MQDLGQTNLLVLPHPSTLSKKVFYQPSGALINHFFFCPHSLLALPLHQNIKLNIIYFQEIVSTLLLWLCKNWVQAKEKSMTFVVISSSDTKF